MKVQRGDVVLADLTFSDQTGKKRRPAVVVSTDKNNSVIDDVILVAVSTVTRRGAFTHVSVDPNTLEGKQSGLFHPSYIQCENLFTLDHRLIIRKLGNLTDALIQQVNACLMAALELP